MPAALRLDDNVRDVIPYYMLMLDRVRQRADDFDVLHFHIDQFQFPLFRPIADRTVTPLHGRQDLSDLIFGLALLIGALKTDDRLDQLVWDGERSNQFN